MARLKVLVKDADLPTPVRSLTTLPVFFMLSSLRRWIKFALVHAAGKAGDSGSCCSGRLLPASLMSSPAEWTKHCPLFCIPGFSAAMFFHGSGVYKHEVVLFLEVSVHLHWGVRMQIAAMEEDMRPGNT